MSTLGSASGAFNNAPQEDDDDLRVPCALSSSVSTSSSLDEISPVFKKATPTVSLSSTSTAAPSVSKDRKVSDFLQFMDEEVLSEMTSPVATAAAVSSMTSLDSDWLNKAFQAEDFASLLSSSSTLSSSTSFLSLPATPHPELMMDLEGSSPSSPPSSPLAAHIQDVIPVDFESLIDLEPVPSLDDVPAVFAAPAPAPSSSKKRGRPAKVEAAPAPKKQRSAEPATPKPHPLTRPQSEDPEELERYVKYRASNNEAACKSRLRRKEREKENSERVVLLEAQNAELRKELASLQGECKKLKSLLENFLASQK